MKAILTRMPQYVIGEVFLSRERLAAQFASERGIVCMRSHMVH